MSTPAEELRALIARGLTFAEAIDVFAETRTPRQLAYVAAAQEAHMGDEGDIEVDDAAAVSAGDDEGAYVMAWTWIPAEVIASTEGGDHASN